MSARAETSLLVDASTVYAEGQLWGLRYAAQIIGKFDESDIPPAITKAVRELRCTVYHNQWMFQHGHAVPLSLLPDRTALCSRIHAFLALFPGDSNEQ